MLTNNGNEFPDDAWEHFVESGGRAEPSAQLRTAAAGVAEIYTALTDAGLPKEISRDIIMGMIMRAIASKLSPLPPQ